MAVREEAQPPLDGITEVATGVLRMQLPIEFPGLGHVNCYALEDERGFALVDPGLPGDQAWQQLQSKLSEAGIPLARVHSVIVTHSHPDHFGGAGRLREATGADIVTHASFRVLWAPADDDGPEPEQLAEAGEAPEARGPFGRPTPWGGTYAPMTKEHRDRVREELARPGALPTPTKRLTDADTIRLAGREWVAVHTPGHTPDHLCLFDPAEGVVLSGDHVLPTITPHIAGVGNVSNPLDEFFSSLAKVAALPGVRQVLPAHGLTFTDLAGRAGEIHDHHLERLERLMTATRELDRPANVNELMKHLFSERAWGSMAESETFAHLEHLRIDGRVTCDWHDGWLFYELAEASAR
jgi:glyoxylase-like metal-dependent hydrolase (beta-lactamase superfamily II)